MGFRVAILSQQLSPSGSGVPCPQPPCSGSGRHAQCYAGSWWGPGRHSPKRVASPYIFQRSKCLQLSIPGHSLVSQASPINLCLAGQVLQFSAPSSVSPCSPALNPKPCGTSTWWTSLRAYGCPSVPFQPTWPRERMAAMSSLNPGPELPV